MFCFGTVAEQMGFAVERIQTAFPDCETLREQLLTVNGIGPAEFPYSLLFVRTFRSLWHQY